MSFTRTDAPFNSRRTVILAFALLFFAIATAIGYNQQPTRYPFAPELSWKDWEKWKAPVEMNAFRRLVSVNAIYSIRFMEDGRQGWAVGDDGTILASSDGGRNWVAQSSGSKAHLRSAHFLTDGQRGWAVGWHGTILASINGGRNWVAQRSGTKVSLLSVYFLADAHRGWAVGNDGTILASINGGRNWVAQSSGSKESLSSVHFLPDGQRGWVVGGKGTILTTNDGGRSWVMQSSGSKASLQSVHFLTDGQRGWAAGWNGIILATSDGGLNWAAQSISNKAMLQSVHFLADGQRGWAVGEKGAILTTGDGGRNWTAQRSGSKTMLQSVHFLADTQRGWATGDDGTILATSDGGRNWAAHSSGWHGWLESVHFLTDGQRGWAVGNDGTILASKDGGLNWDVQNSSSEAGWLRSVHFLTDGQRGWVVGFGNPTLASNDGGRNWVEQNSGKKLWLLSGYFLADGQRGWGVGIGGEILTSSDGGRNWAKQNSGTKEQLESIQFLDDGLRGWVVGGNGTILITSDGGRNWAKQNSGTKEQLESIQFLDDGLRGWVVGGNGTILITSDGGRNWAKQNSGNEVWLESVHFLTDGQRGWTVGDDGSILASSDGGKTWRKQASGTGAMLRSIQFLPDGQTGFIVGRGVILYSHDGGATWSMPQYHRSLAPWVYTAWLGIFLLTLLALLIERKIRHENTVADLLVSDEPIAQMEDDRLGHRELVAALSAFLRNRRTVPPLSLAITAPWGKGKSSVMHLLSQSLQRHGVCTVWFNAWHHQKEEIVLASLLENIRAQALPFWLTPWGLWFRIALLFRRMERHYTVAGLVGFVALFGMAVLTEHGDKLPQTWRAIAWQPLLQLEWKNFVEQLYKTVALHPQLIHIVTGLAALVAAAAFALLYGLRAFPEHPAVLLATLSGKFKTRHAEAQTAFRYKFSRHFGDVCEALRPRTLTVFIDDLDRCTPEKALETLEAVNYLVSSGACYVVLGMDKKVVESLVGLASEKLAREMMAEAAVPNRDKSIKPTESVAEEVEKRRTYARQYLEKLVNFELPVPTVEPGGYHKLARQRREWKLTLLHDINLLSLRLSGSFLFALIAGFLAAFVFVSWNPAPLAENLTTPVTTVAQAQTVTAKPLSPDMGAKPNQETKPRGGGSFVPADPLNDYEFVAWIIAFIL